LTGNVTKTALIMVINGDIVTGLAVINERAKNESKY
jgi:hypothetical protein